MKINENIIRKIIRESLLEVLDDINVGEGDKFKPDIEWLKQMYNYANETLFGGVLRECDFEIIPLGARTLGRFVMKNQNLRFSRTTGQLYVTEFWGDKTPINLNNFVNLCHPTIQINSNYSATKFAHFTTLVHEMCHYYTHMKGHYSTRHHGSDFKYIASIVSYRSGGKITIERLARAEEMSDRELDANIQQRVDARKERKKTNASYIVVLKNGIPSELINTKNQTLIQKIIDLNKKRGNTVINVINHDLIEKLFNMGYSATMRKYRYWDISTKPISKEILSSPDNYETIS